MSQWTLSHRPRRTWITTYEMKPAPTPFVMLNVKGMTIMVRSAGMPTDASAQSISFTTVIMK